MRNCRPVSCYGQTGPWAQRPGRHVDGSLLDGQPAWLTYVAQGYFTTGTAPRPHGTAHPTIVPYRALRTGEGHLMVAAGNDKLWRALAETIGCGEPADDPRGRTVTRLKVTVSVTGQE
ncbi:hypothetical protein GCM10010145_17140 [Streptomyces ruber]|uniref:Uncharacterized protein n=2 Tax=Streptomyces TaxID=1883 RepID=A0A918EPH6_9ACTN|nr:hypothetical protein GCM10010145_17140 [Streptomyces ruber]